MTTSLERVDGADPELLSLVRAQVAEVMERYATDDPGPEVAETTPFLLARLDGEPVGCVAVAPLGPGTGELKRMYVAPVARGRGLGRVLLEAAERMAAEQGHRLLRLETGTEQPEAVALYERSGWTRIPCYGHFADDPRTICLEKALPG